MRCAAVALAAVLFSLSACRSHRTVVKEAGLNLREMSVDSVVARRWAEVRATAVTETVDVEFFAPDTMGRQAVRRVRRQRRSSENREADTSVVAAARLGTRSTVSSVSEKAEPPALQKGMLAATVAVLTTLILLTLTIRKRQ